MRGWSGKNFPEGNKKFPWAATRNSFLIESEYNEDEKYARVAELADALL